MSLNDTTKHSNNFKDRAGQRFGRLLVLREAERPPHLKGRSAYWECLCDCGNKTTVSGNSLSKGDTKSCGCWHKECATQQAANTKKHGLVNSPEYKAYCGMKYRCYNKKASNWASYGGRGITVCDRWRESFEAFYEDMGARPSPKHSLDRIDNNGPYSPDNCRWATNEQQSNNRRHPRPHTDHPRYTYNGKTQTLSEWARELNIQRNILQHRIKRGWSIERAFSESVHA